MKIEVSRAVVVTESVEFDLKTAMRLIKEATLAGSFRKIDYRLDGYDCLNGIIATNIEWMWFLGDVVMDDEGIEFHFPIDKNGSQHVFQFNFENENITHQIC